MVVQSASYPHQNLGAISVLFTPKAGVNKHFIINNHYYNKFDRNVGCGGKAPLDKCDAGLSAAN